jgi:hypothetical protein
MFLSSIKEILLDYQMEARILKRGFMKQDVEALS